MMDVNNGPILHVLVVGFHHKKGCQVEYSFPALVPNSTNECPPGWKYLPTLALPDGSHNYDEDTAYFHLPSLTDSKKTVFGISCYRQISVERLKNRTDDITRSTVQKAVCVLSKLPLYGHIQVKMSLITHAYFEEGDFSKVSLLEQTYHHLNACLTQAQIPPQIFVGLSARDFILHWRHKAVLLFKLMLLERRLIFYRSPVQPLCSTILTLLSLHPGMIEKGLEQSACIKPSRPMSPIPDFEDIEDCCSISTNIIPNHKDVDCKLGEPLDLSLISHTEINSLVSPAPLEPLNHVSTTQNYLSTNEKSTDSTVQTESNYESHTQIIESEKFDSEKLEIDTSSDLGLRDEKTILPRDTSMDTLVDVTAHTTMTKIAHVNIEGCGTPLQIFTKGFMCLPYLSLPYMDLLGDVNVRGYIVGATNVLFKQKRQLADVLIEIEGARIESQDTDLRRQLHLTTEDLRFADFVVKHVSEERHDVFLDGVGWEGGDEWIRSQFRVYLLCLLRTSLLQDGSRELDHYNVHFMNAWKETHNYKIWLNSDHNGILEINPGHPFAGQLSVADMKLRLAHTMQNTEGGRKLNQAMVSTGRAVATTGRAVGGAISQAKGALSSWWNNLTTVSPESEQAVINDAQEVEENQITDIKEIVLESHEDCDIKNDCISNKMQSNIYVEIAYEITKNNEQNSNSANDILVQKSEILAEYKDEESNKEKELYEPGRIHTV